MAQASNIILSISTFTLFTYILPIQSFRSGILVSRPYGLRIRIHMMMGYVPPGPSGSINIPYAQNRHQNFFFEKFGINFLMLSCFHKTILLSDLSNFG